MERPKLEINLLLFEFFLLISQAVLSPQILTIKPLVTRQHKWLFKRSNMKKIILIVYYIDGPLNKALFHKIMLTSSPKL